MSELQTRHPVLYLSYCSVSTQDCLQHCHRHTSCLGFSSQIEAFLLFATECSVMPTLQLKQLMAQCLPMRIKSASSSTLTDCTPGMCSATASSSLAPLTRCS